MAKLRMLYVPIDELPSADRNPKAHDQPSTKASISRFGFIQPTIRDERTGKLIAGHGRRDALIDMRDAGEDPPEGIVVDARKGWTAPVVVGYTSPNDIEAEAAGVALNRIGEGLWDIPTLADVLGDVREQSTLELDGLGYTSADLDTFLHQLDMQSRRKDDGADPDEIPPTPKRARTRKGDLWIMGDHRVLCGDSTNADDVARVLAGDPIDFVFTSPPYNVGIDYESGEEEDGAPWAEYEPLLRGVIGAFMPHVARGRVVAWQVGASPKVYPHRQLALLESFGLTFRRELIWRKMGVPVQTWHMSEHALRVRRFTPNWVYEYVHLMANGDVEAGGAADHVEPRLRDDVFQVNQVTERLWTDDSDGVIGNGAGSWINKRGDGQRGKVHPAPFPVALPEAFIGWLADRGAVVFDPFMGSGSTIIAAHRAGRRGVGVELSPQYCDVIAERWQRVTGEMPVLERTGKPVDFLKASTPRT